MALPVWPARPGGEGDGGVALPARAAPSCRPSLLCTTPPHPRPACCAPQAEDLLREALLLQAALDKAVPAAVLERLLPKRYKQYQKVRCALGRGRRAAGPWRRTLPAGLAARVVPSYPCLKDLPPLPLVLTCRRASAAVPELWQRRACLFKSAGTAAAQAWTAYEHCARMLTTLYHDNTHVFAAHVRNNLPFYACLLELNQGRW